MNSNFRNRWAFRQVCIKHDFCNVASNDQYEYIMKMLENGRILFSWFGFALRVLRKKKLDVQ